MQILWVFLAISIPLIAVIIFFVISNNLVKEAICPKRVDYGTVQSQEMQRNHLDSSLLDLKYDKIFHTNSRGQELVGRLYCTQTQTNRYLLFNHAYNYPWIGALKYIPMFMEHGFNVFVPDHQAEGESEGETITFGYYESLDSLEWLEELQKHAIISGFVDAEIGVMGESMGAVTALLMAEKEPQTILFCIADCPFSSWDAIMQIQAKKKHNLSIRRYLPTMKWMIHNKTGADMNRINMLRVATKLRVPTLIIHGKEDNLIPYSMSEEIAAKNPKIQLYLQDTAKHMNSYATDPIAYKKRILEFLKTINFETEHNEEFIM